MKCEECGNTMDYYKDYIGDDNFLFESYKCHICGNWQPIPATMENGEKWNMSQEELFKNTLEERPDLKIATIDGQELPDNLRKILDLHK
jgi:hypothetical protein